MDRKRKRREREREREIYMQADNKGVTHSSQRCQRENRSVMFQVLVSDAILATSDLFTLRCLPLLALSSVFLLYFSPPLLLLPFSAFSSFVFLLILLLIFPLLLSPSPLPTHSRFPQIFPCYRFTFSDKSDLSYNIFVQKFARHSNFSHSKLYSLPFLLISFSSLPLVDFSLLGLATSPSGGSRGSQNVGKDSPSNGSWC